MLDFVRTVVIIFLIIYTVRLFTRYILPALFVNYVGKKMNDFNHPQKKQQQTTRREGEVTIDYKPETPSKNKPSRGDYVDYVEVKDKQ